MISSVTPRRWLRRILAGALLPLMAISAARAETYIQIVNHNGSGDWNVLAHWNTAGNGSGSSPTAITNADDFVGNNNGRILRTPTGVSSFGGKSLTIGPATHVLEVRSGSSVATVPNLITLGAAKVRSGGTQSNLAVTSWLNQSGTTDIINHGHASANFPLAIGALTGSGNFHLTAGSATGLLQLTIADAKDYLGAITLASGRLQFMNAVSSAGALIVEAGGTVILNHAVTFTGLTVGETTYPPGTYSAGDLGFQGTGSVTVRTSQTWYLTTKQSGTQNWTEAFLSNWNSQSNGSGVAPPSINIFDDYVSQASGGELRTLNAASTFGGGSLTLANTSRLTIRTPANVVSTIPAFITAGTPTIGNGIGNIRQNLALGDWEVFSGTTRLSATAGRSLGFDIEYLSGLGTLQTQDGGAFFLSLHNGSGYTGTLNHASGSLRFEGVFSTQGAFTVGSSATVHLDQPAYFTSFSVGGVAKPAGIHKFTTLNSEHPARFPSGSASGLVGVYTPDTTGPAHMFGVNLAGPESRNRAIFPGTYGSQWIYPSAASYAYYHSKGLNLIRLPFRWERMQTSLGSGVLNAAELARMDAAVGHAATHGMKVILDMHNYARWVPGSNHDGHLIGTGPVTLDHFGEVWRLLADHYKGNSTIYGYGIMNEPHGTNGTWPVIAQTAVDAIRTVDLGTYVIVGGDHYSNSIGWRAKNPNLDIQDPVGRLIYEAHCYFDANNQGIYNNSYDGEGAYPMVGVDRVTEFVEWLQERGAKGFIGEYGVPGNDHRWLEALDNFLAYLDANGVSGTYWAGGPWWGSYPLSVEPTNNYTTDKPQMGVLENYTGGAAPASAPPAPAEFIVDNLDAVVSGGWNPSDSYPGYHGVNYLHDGNGGKGTKTVQFIPDLDAGTYEVSLRWTSDNNRSAAVPVAVAHTGGTSHLTVNQKTNGGMWFPVGTFTFAEGTGGSVTISTTGTVGFVIADAVRFVRVSGDPVEPVDPVDPTDPALVVSYDFPAGDTLAPKNGWAFSNPNWPMGQLPGGGGNAMPFTYGAEPVGEDGWSEHRFSMPSADEFWIRLRWHVPENYHHRVDTYLEIANAYAAGWRVGDIVRGRDGTSQAAISRITGTVVYLRDAPNSYSNGVWLGQLTNLTRSTTLTSTVRRREAVNNKLLAIWCDDYSSHGIGSTIVWQTDHWDDGTEKVVLTVGYSVGNNTTTGGVIDGGQLITPGDRGKYMDIIFHGKFATSPTANDGIIRTWVRKEGQASYTQFLNITNANIKKPTTLPAAEQFWKRGYLMGWSNSGFDQTTTFHLSKIEYYNAMPAVLAP